MNHTQEEVDLAYTLEVANAAEEIANVWQRRCVNLRLELQERDRTISILLAQLAEAQEDGDPE